MSGPSPISPYRPEERQYRHPRSIAWIGASALAMGGSNLSLILFAGAGGLIATKGSAAVPLLIIGLLLAWAAAPGWIELVLMWPNRVGGISASCAEAFRPYSPVLANLTGTCYWWGWIPVCGLTALLAASAIHQWYLPKLPISLLAVGIIVAFTSVNLAGLKWAVRLALPMATLSALLAFLSAVIPVLTGQVDWRVATDFTLITPFGGAFGKITSFMAGLYLVGFAAPAFEAAACHVGEMVDPEINVPKAIFASGAMASLYVIVLPIVWLGVFGTWPLVHDLQNILGPTLAPFLGPAARSAAVWFITLNMFHGTLQPLCGASRTLAQLAEDGLLPRTLAIRNQFDCPHIATLVTAGMAILFLYTGVPTWVIAAANLTYLIGIALPNVAVWLLRRDAPDMNRPYRASDNMIVLGLAAAVIWGIATILGFQQFGLPTVLTGLALAYSGSAMYMVRVWADRRESGERAPAFSLHAKLTGAMLIVLSLDGGGYLLAISNVPSSHIELITALEDIFVAVALLTITVGLILPGMIAQAAHEITFAAQRLARGTLADFSKAMVALGKGDLDFAYAKVNIVPVKVHSTDEMSVMADSFNSMQEEIANAVTGLSDAREAIRDMRAELTSSNKRFSLAVSGSKDGLWDWDIASDRVYFSPRWKAIIGYEPEELPNNFTSWINNIHVDDEEAVVRHMQAYLDRAVPDFEIEFRMIHRDGSHRWILARGVAVRDVAGTPYRMAGSHTDITERKAIEEERLSLANYNQLLLQSSGDGIFGMDLAGNCTFINDAGAKMLGYRPEVMNGKNFHNLVHHTLPDGSANPASECLLLQSIAQGRQCRVDSEVFWRSDGSSFPVEYSSAAIRENGVIRGGVVTFVDITERRRAQEELIQAKLSAEAASRAKSLFLANMSHELRTPLNAVIGFSEILDKQVLGPLNAKQARFVGNTLTSGRHLLDLIEGVLDLSKIEAGRTSLHYTMFDVAGTVTGILFTVKAISDKKSIKVNVDVATGMPLLMADETRFRQILYNLVSNAIKFTPDGGTIFLQAHKLNEEFELAIRDSGIGLSEEHLERIWGEFEQVDSSYSRSQQGAGLGLALTKHLVRLHGGRVWAESKGEGFGSTFIVRLPWLSDGAPAGLNSPEPTMQAIEEVGQHGH